LGEQPALFAEDHYATATTDRKLLVALDRKSGTVEVHELASGKHLRDIRFGKWAGPAAQPLPADFQFLWEVHPRRPDMPIALGSWGDPDLSVVRVLDLDAGTVRTELPSNPRVDIHGLGWHPDGRTLVVGYAQGVVLWDVPSGRIVGRITDHKGGAIV